MHRKSTLMLKKSMHMHQIVAQNCVENTFKSIHCINSRKKTLNLKLKTHTQLLIIKDTQKKKNP